MKYLDKLQELILYAKRKRKSRSNVMFNDRIPTITNDEIFEFLLLRLTFS